MAIQKINTAVDTVGSWATAYNTTCDNIVITGTTTNGVIQLGRFDNVLVTIANSLPFVHVSASNRITANSNTNTNSGSNSSILGGTNNTASANYVVVGGGFSNQATFQYSFVGGGLSNLASGNASAVLGGIGNTASGGGAAVLAGLNNTASANYSSVIAGSGQTANEVCTAYAQNICVQDKIKIKNGSNPIAGTVSLIGGTKTVTNSNVDSNSLIFVTSQVNQGTPGFLSVASITSGSFVINSSSASDTSIVAYFIVTSV